MIEWNSEQRRLREDFEARCEALNADHLRDDRLGSFSREKWEVVRESDVLRIPFDVANGGLGHDLLTMMHVLEGMGHRCRDNGIGFSTVTHVVSTGISVQRFGSEHLRTRYLPSICDGSMIGAHAITEPGGGSDVMNMRTTAVRDGDHFVLNGEKAFVTNGPVADAVVVYARTDPRPGPFAITAFLVERGTPGLVFGEPVDKMGLRTSPFCGLVLEDCRVPAGNVIGRPGGGFPVLDHVMKWEILCSFILVTGQMQHRVQRCVEYAGRRSQFGRPIGSYQSVSNEIVKMKIGVETSRKWLYDTAEKFLANVSVTTDIAISKLVASESNVSSALAAMQIFGGRGYLTEYGLERDVRDALSGTVYSGTSEIQRQRIASMLGLTAQHGPDERA